jgi:hypothetical protein
MLSSSIPEKMDFDFKRLMECDEPFFGIVPCKAAYPMCRVSLPVTFDTEENFRTEYLSFEVADFKSFYHAILGRPMLARCNIPKIRCAKFAKI